ncbi:hypothetical protein FORC36_4097 [Vibrio vulnificus]|nr:hypothetical protein FORC36_4097 [Vibrio vulnificus]
MQVHINVESSTTTKVLECLSKATSRKSALLVLHAVRLGWSQGYSVIGSTCFT